MLWVVVDIAVPTCARIGTLEYDSPAFGCQMGKGVTSTDVTVKSSC